jgi:4-nitrophenyl phosphatase
MIAGVLFDIEGTLVGDKRYQPTVGAVDLVKALRRRSVPLRLITNNTTHSADEIVGKLGSAGFDFVEEELITCIGATADLLRDRGLRRCLVIGGEKLRQLLGDRGVVVVDDEDASAVVVGLDTELTFAKLRVATAALLRRGAPLVALHQNRLYTDAQGRVAPSVGAIVAALSYAAGVEPLVVGKPSAGFYEQALRSLGMPAADVLVISDDPFSDLAGAKRLGMFAALVLTGKYRDRSVVDEIDPAERPDTTSDDLADLAGCALLAPLLRG